MGRWVRWFGSEEEAPTGSATFPAPSLESSGTSGRVMTVSAERACVVADLGEVGMAPAPTGQISIETLPAEMLTAVLVEEGALTRENEHACLQEHRATGRPVEEIICESGFVAESELMSILSRRCKVPHLSLERYRIREEVLESVPAEFARANHVMPLERLGKVLNVATSNPLNMVVLKRLEEETGLKVKPVLATPRELAECIEKHFPAPAAPEEPEPSEEEFRVTARDILKESWLGRIDEEGGPEETAAAAEEGPAVAEEAPARSGDSRPIPLSEDEAGAFVKTSSADLFEAWAAFVGSGSGGGPVAATALTGAEFELLAAEEPSPLPPPKKEASPAGASKRRSARKKSRKKRRKKKSGR